MNELHKPEDEMSLKDLFVKIKEIYFLLRPHFILIVVFSAIAGAIGFGYAFLIPPRYEASLSFMVDAGKSNSLGGVSQLASSFGLGSLGGNGNNLDSKKIENLVMSNTVNSIALFEKETIEGKSDFLANHFLTIFKIKEEKEFLASDSISDFTEFTHADFRKFTFKENSILQIILSRILGKNGLLAVEVSKNEIITVKLITESKVFAKYYVEHLVNALTNFYVSSTIKKEKISLGVINDREDSVKRALYAAEYAYAAFKDENLKMVKVQGYVEEFRLKRNVEILTAMYAEIIKSKEMANFALLNKTPLFQIIDEPSFPLKVITKSKAMFLVLGSAIGFFLIIGFLILKKYLLFQ